MDPERLPPGQLWRSFLKIAVSYVAILGVMIGVMVVVAPFCFPESFKLLTEKELGEAEMISKFDEIMPPALFWTVAGAGALVSFCCGWMITRSCGPANTAHTVFLAIVLFVSGLQVALGSQAEVRWMPWVMAGLLPVSTLLGAKLGLRQIDGREAGMENNQPQDLQDD